MEISLDKHFAESYNYSNEYELALKILFIYAKWIAYQPDNEIKIASEVCIRELKLNSYSIALLEKFQLEDQYLSESDQKKRRIVLELIKTLTEIGNISTDREDLDLPSLRAIWCWTIRIASNILNNSHLYPGKDIFQ
jgi:hypothetical protein